MLTPKTLFSLLGTLLCLASPALADTITFTSNAIPTFTLSPSSDTITMDAGTATLSGPGNVVLQTGNFYVGNSPIPDQVIPFFFNDTITINGITQIVTIYGQDDITYAADVLSIFAGAPVNFGSYNLYVNASSYNGVALYQNLPVSLNADVTPVGEPATLLLLATGLIGGALVTTRFGRPASATLTQGLPA